MTDDVKAAHARLNEIEGIVGAEPVIRTALWEMERIIDGEPARTAAAVAAAREEQRAADAEHLARIWYGLPDAGRADHGPVAVVRSTPLTATPLADRIAELEAESRDCIETCVRSGLKERRTLLETVGGAVHDVGLHKSIAANWRARAEKAEAERDRLAGDALAALAGAGVATPLEGYAAARAGLNAIASWSEGPDVCGGFDEPGSAQTARDTLAAMDGAKP